MLKQEHPSLLRNRLIAHVFYRAGYIEAWGRGTVAIIEQLKTEGYEAPLYEENAGGIRLIFNGKLMKNTNVTENVTENRRIRILNLLTENNQLSTSQIANKMEVVRRTIARDIDALKAQGRLKRIGPDKGGHWEVVAKR